MTRRSFAVLLSAVLLFNLVMPSALAVGRTEVAAPSVVAPRGPGSAPLAAVDDDIPGVPAPASPIVDTLDEFVDFDDVFSLDLTAGQVLTVSMTGAGGTNFDVYLFPPGSAALTDPSVAFSGGDTYPEAFTYTATTSGTYYLDVWVFAGTGSYTLTYSIGTAAVDDNFPGVPAPPSPIVDTVDEFTDPDDIFSLDLSAGQVLTVSMTGAAGTDFEVLLFPPGSTSVLEDTPVASSTGETYPETFSYAAPATGTYYLDVWAWAGSGSYTLTYSVNSAPVAVNDGYSTAQNTMLTVAAPGVLANDTDANAGDTLIASVVVSPASGVLSLAANGSFTYMPAAGFTGAVTFTYVASDGTVNSNIATVTITVTAANAPPVLGAIGAKSVNELSQLAFTATATDANGGPLTFSLGAGAPTGAAITAGGAFTWTPSEAQGPGVYPITVVVSDGTLTDSEAVTVTVAEVNAAPVLSTIGNKSLTLGQTLAFTATASDADVPANTKTFSLGAGAPAGATINASTGAFSWTPSAAGTFSITVRVSDGALIDTETITVTVSAAPPGLVVLSIEGPNRYATAIAASQKAFPTGSDYVIVATGANWPDALGGSALAGVLDAPILLTRQDVLPAEVRAEIVRLGATKAIILGGTPAVSAAVAGQIDAIAGVSVERISGPNRYDTAIAVAARTIAVLGSAYDGRAFVATGLNFPDALGASPLAAAAGWPIYLANPNQGNNAGLVSVMRAAGVTDAILLGGANVVADSIRVALGATYETRLAGANRYDTAVVVATYGVANAGLGWDKVAIATGQNFPDALAGGVLQGKDGSVLLLTPTASLNANVAAKLAANKASIHEVRFLGSTAAVSAAVRTAVTNILQN